MKYLLTRFFFIVVASLCAYALLIVLRGFGVSPEVRGVWAGAVGFMLGDIALNGITHSRKRRSKR